MCLNTLNRGPGQYPRELVMPASQGDAEWSTTAGPFGQTVQGATIGELADQDITVQMLPTAKCWLSGGCMEETQQDLGVTKRLWELHVTDMKPPLSLQQEPKDPDLGGHTHKVHPRSPRFHWNLGRTWQLCSTLRQPSSLTILKISCL
jgi:hypothetical protein